ncbi:hypothetical protein, partial [Paraglaciecola sp.]|uniref:hypothetical protein n=1 Tax=Paraglaciecola sp. TaxID=1920173 RepID=UPI003EFB27E3
ILPLSTELKEALCSQQGVMGELLVNLIGIEKNQLKGQDNLALRQLKSTYWQGLKWADELMGSITQ